MNIFKNFTNQYELSKTLRFELKPIGNTQKMLEDNKVFETDEKIQKKYQQTKKYLDQMHREFVVESLKNLKLLNLEKYQEALKNVKKITRDTEKKQANDWIKKLEDQKKRLRKEVVAFFNAKAKEWSKEYLGLKNKDLKIFYEEAVFYAILKEKYGQEKKSFLLDEKGNFILDKNGEKISIFDEWKGFTGYFTKFFETRKNFYESDGTSTAIATRIIDQNLRRYAENTETIKKYPHKLLSKLNAIELKRIKSIKKYPQFVLQGNKEKAEGINFYNVIVGKIKYEINQHRQKIKQKLPYLKTLDNQILSEKDKFIEEIKDDDHLKKELIKFLDTGKKKTKILKKLFSEFVKHQKKFDLEKIYFSKKGFEQISRMWTDETYAWEEELAKAFKNREIKLSKKKDAGYSFPDFIPLEYLKESLESLPVEDQENFWKLKHQEKIDSQQNIWTQFLEIFFQEFLELFEKEINTDTGTRIVGYTKFFQELEDVLKIKKLEKTPKLTVAVKNFADSFLSLYQFSKYFAVEKAKKWDDSVETDDEFYNNLEYGFFDKYYKNSFEKIITPYNLLRNYLTKKPWESVQKWKLNFENATLLTGWPDSPDGNTQYGSFIFRKGKKYFLGVTDYPRIFDKERFPEAYSTENSSYEKMVYKQVDAKTLYGSVYKGVFGSKYSEDQEILDDKELVQRIKKVLETRVNFFPSLKVFIDKIRNNQYLDAKSLAREISEGSFYNVSFVPISDLYVEKGIYNIPKNKKGDTVKKLLYLFQIKNKDWNKGSTGKKNLHTLYFENLFSSKNESKNFPFKLNGQAEIFHRPKAIEAKKVKRNFTRKIIEKKRYTKDKTFFHVPITLNRGKGKLFSLNREINNFLANNSDINIIGVDRGEKHLAYYSVINQKGKILESDSLNAIKGGDGKKVNYQQKLEKKANEREQQRRDWQSVQGIKDLKKGYISQVVRKLADLAIKHNAIIVFEDLNMRFKQIRGGIEKSIYQQLEKALIEKLNFLVYKGEKNPKEAGHLLKAYQLTAPFETFQKMRKQTGIIFYTTASYTSKIDPITGWRPNVYFKKGSAKLNKENIAKFSAIVFNTEKNRFEFTYDLKKIIKSEKAKYPQKTEWTVCSNVQRFKGSRKEKNNNQWGYDEYPATGKNSITEHLKQLFKKYKIKISRNILRQIKQLETKGNEKFFSDLLFFFQLICQIRNTDARAKDLDKQDFILSPVEIDGNFFDSRNSENAKKNLPKNGDENGAYNIARKGIITLQRINEWAGLSDAEKEKIKYPDLFITDAEWDAFATKSKKFVSSLI